MDHVVIRISRWRQIVPLVGCMAACWVSYFKLVERYPSWITWAVVIASGIGAVIYAAELMEDSKRLVIDERGIWNSVWPGGLVRWKELRGVFVRSDGGQDFICFTVGDREEMRRRLGPVGRLGNDATRATGFGDLTLNATRFGLSTPEVVEFASRKIAEV